MRKLNLGAGAADIDTLAGETGTALEDMGAGANGHVELRGTTWSARNTGSTPLARGHRCVVVRAEQTHAAREGRRRPPDDSWSRSCC